MDELGLNLGSLALQVTALTQKTLAPLAVVCNIGLNFVSLFLLFAILTMVQQFREIEKPSWSKKKQKKLKKTLSKSSAEPLRQQLRRLPH